jgi:hypothetical protein
VELNLETLGITKEELTNLVVERIAKNMLDTSGWDWDARIDKLIREKIDARVKEIGDTVVLPLCSAKIEDLIIRETNKYGEETGKSKTFVEYLVARAEAYITEKVSDAGKSKAEDGNDYNWRGSQTRITHMVHSHLQYHIKAAIEAALKDMNSKVALGIAETVKLQLGAVMNGLKVNVTTKS